MAIEGEKGRGEADALDTQLLKAFTHPLRRRIFLQIWEAAAAVSPRQASEILDHPLSNVSYHVRVLAGVEAIECVATEPVRGSMQHFYRVHPKVAEVKWLTAYLEHAC